MHKLSEYAKVAAKEYSQETGRIELDSVWIARFFQDSGLLEDYPRQDLVAFGAMVQKELILNAERAAKETRSRRVGVVRFVKRPREP